MRLWSRRRRARALLRQAHDLSTSIDAQWFLRPKDSRPRLRARARVQALQKQADELLAGS